MPLKNEEPRYVISVAARILGCEIHTLRYYEKLGLVQPHRSAGNIRYYSESDIEKLRYVKMLMEDMGINVAGVEAVVWLGQKIVELQNRIHELEVELQEYVATNTNRKKKKSRSGGYYG